MMFYLPPGSQCHGEDPSAMLAGERYTPLSEQLIAATAYAAVRAARARVALSEVLPGSVARLARRTLRDLTHDW
jgi:hypothetical protein